MGRLTRWEGIWVGVGSGCYEVGCLSVPPLQAGRWPLIFIDLEYLCVSTLLRRFYSYCACAAAVRAGEMPAVAAIVGGVLANDLLKAVAHKGEPLRNLFMYSLTDGVGSVEPYGC